MLASLTVTLADLPSRGELERFWTDLQTRCDHSFYLSWGWLGSWLHTLPPEIVPQLLQVHFEERVVGAALAVRRRTVRGKVISSRGLYLQETGHPTCDDIVIEHNGLLAERQLETPVWHAIFEYLAEEQGQWDELFASGIDDDNPLASLIYSDVAPPNSYWKMEREKACHFADLAVLQQQKQEYLSTLSANTRSQVRRAMKLYAEQGALHIEEASDLPTAMQFFDEMKVAHTKYWQSQGSPGAFTSEFCDQLHRNIINERFPHGEVQLLKVRAGENVFGYLYNFVYQGRVLSYQSGFHYDENPKLKPGLVSHALAIEHCVARGHQIYDFLAGDSQYKRMLSHSSKKMRWYILRRHRVKFRVEAALRSVKRLCLR